MCNEEKERMKEVDGGQLGSWQRVVVTSDVMVYGIRGVISVKMAHLSLRIISLGACLVMVTSA